MPTIFGVPNVDIFNEAEDQVYNYHDLIRSERLLVLDIATFTAALATQEAAGFQLKAGHRGHHQTRPSPVVAAEQSFDAGV